MSGRKVDVDPKQGKGERRVRRKRVRTSSGRSGSVRRLMGMFGICVGLFGAATAGYLLVAYPMSSGPGRGAMVEFRVNGDESRSELARRLERAHLIKSSSIFYVYSTLIRLRPSVGVHLLTDDASPEELSRRLAREGKASRAKVTVVEGFTRFDIARRLEERHVTFAQAFLDATANTDLLRDVGISGETAEGYLFPATYDLPFDADPKEIVRRLVAEFERRFSLLEQSHKMGRAQLESSLGWKRREIVTLASMVEREAAVDEERPVIASVFLNRLRDPSFKKKLLQSDPTSAYGCVALRDRIPSCAGFAGKPTHATNVDPLNVYSTYVHEGLPPGPIGNPGSKAIEAVLAPATTKYLYFVVRGDRRHAFSETLDEHKQAVREYRERTQRQTESGPGSGMPSP